MDNNYVIIEINGIQYFCEASRLNDIQYINGKLVNVSNSSITLVNNYDFNVTTYPRIICNATSQCYLRNTQQSNIQGVNTNYNLVSKFNINTLGNLGLLSAILFSLLLIVGLRLLWKK